MASPAHPHIHPTAPCLMLPRTAEDQSLDAIRLLCLLCDERLVVQTVPAVARWSYCVSSCGNWLMVLDDVSNPHLFNPITGTYLSLPPFSTFPNIETEYAHSDGPISSYRLHHRHPAPLAPPEAAGRYFFTKAIVGFSSPTTYTVMVLCDEYLGGLAFTREGDQAWTYICSATSFQDVMLLNGRFYVLSFTGKVTVYDFPSGGHARPKTRVISDDLLTLEGCKRRYLAHAHDGRSIYQILKLKDNKHYFSAYKLLGNKRWVPLKHFGGCSFFLGDNHVISVQTRSSIPAIPADRVYFTDVYQEHETQPRLTLQDFITYGDTCKIWIPPPIPDTSSLQLLFENFSTCYRQKYLHTWPRPLWFMPSSSAEQWEGEEQGEGEDEHVEPQEKKGKEGRQMETRSMRRIREAEATTSKRRGKKRRQ